jgi:hypothetical protein
VGQTVDATEGHSLRRFAPQHVELVSKNQGISASNRALDRNSLVSAHASNLRK